MIAWMRNLFQMGSFAGRGRVIRDLRRQLAFQQRIIEGLVVRKSQLIDEVIRLRSQLEAARLQEVVEG